MLSIKNYQIGSFNWYSNYPLKFDILINIYVLTRYLGAVHMHIKQAYLSLLCLLNRLHIILRINDIGSIFPCTVQSSRVQ